jgi:septal ring factor EnvC (AmiA/AmiB activator)
MMHKVRTLLPAALLAAAIGGCTAPQSQRPAPATTAGDNGLAAKRFQDPPGAGRTAAQSALELSEKYAKLSEEAATLRQENQRLAGENEDLRGQIAALDAKLKQTQKELGEANELLLELLNELNNWKGNILGFRSEMREAAQAQLEALLKVLEILGGEAEAGTLERRHAGTLNPDVNEVPPSQSTFEGGAP